LKILGNWCLMFGHAWKKNVNDFCKWHLKHYFIRQYSQGTVSGTQKSAYLCWEVLVVWCQSCRGWNVTQVECSNPRRKKAVEFNTGSRVQCGSEAQRY
jgi:hypothetical protein